MIDMPIVLNERVDDLAVLLAQSQRMGVPELADAHFPTHGNRRGLSLGWVIGIWLSHILSEADHRLNHVQSWVERRLHSLCRCTGLSVTALDFSDDRLADVLSALADDDQWQTFEEVLTQRLVRVYDLTPQRVRADSTSASGHWPITEDGLFQLGLSKDHRPDLPQVKIMLSSLDPLGLPVATQVVSGQRADDPLYVPAINAVRQALARRGLLYIGDCKMAAAPTRAHVHLGGDFYLCPLSQRQLPADGLTSYLAPVWTEPTRRLDGHLS